MNAKPKSWRHKGKQRLQISECERAIDLIENDQVEEAIELLQELPQSQGSRILHDLIDLRRQWNGVNEDERTGGRTREQIDADKTTIVRRLLMVVDEINDVLVNDSVNGPVVSLPVQDLSVSELRARERYLNNLKEDITNRLNVSIHNVRFIDLGVDDSPSATYLPWLYKDSGTSQAFEKYEEAFKAYNRRLLLLGEPGSGKTTTLLHIAQQLILEAEKDPTAPIPLLVNLSKFRLDTPSRSLITSTRKAAENGTQKGYDKRVEHWLASEFVAYPGITFETAQTWIEEGRVAALLDGLDEVDDEYRVELVQVLNATFLKQHPDIPVVVCSRIHEYQPLKSRKETRLQLRGAITLQPLNEEQIRHYLEAAQATNLIEALPKDNVLYQMAKTPLTLSMMTLAYGSTASTEITSNLSLSERRHHLMEAYVAKMVQRNERRKRRIPFDENADNDVPANEYTYSPQKINQYLGWLAVRLSVRMQTAFSPKKFYSFLNREIQRDQQSSVWWALGLARGPLVFVSSVIAGITIVPSLWEEWPLMLLIALLGALLCIPAQWTILERDESPGLAHNARNAAKTIAFLGLALGILGTGSVGLSTILPINISPVSTGIITICLGLIILFSLLGIVDKNTRLFAAWFVLVSLLTLTIVPIISRSFNTWENTVNLIAGSLVLVQVLIGFEAARRAEDLKTAGIFVAIIAAVIVFQIFSVWLVDNLDWYESYILLVSASLIILYSFKIPILHLGGLYLFFILGSLINDTSGAAVGLVIFGYLWLLKVVIEDSATMNRLESRIKFLTQRIENASERYFLSPLLFQAVVLTRGLPVRFNSFFRYSEASLLLKSSADDFEFVHRLLRDYFALRELQPKLAATDFEDRLEAIHNLGYQGISALDTLSDLASDNDNARVREAAVLALGKIASPEIIPHLEAALRDPDPIVRRAAILSIPIDQAREPFKELMEIENDLSVQKTLVEVAMRGVVGFYGGRLYRSEEFKKMIQSNDSLIRHCIDILASSSEIDTYQIPTFSEILTNDHTIDHLIRVLKDKRAKNRAAMAAILGDSQDVRAVTPLIETTVDSSPRIRTAAVSALRKFAAEDDRVAQVLITAVSDKESDVRKAAVSALGKLAVEDEQVLQALITAVSDREPAVRKAAVSALRNAAAEDDRVPQVLITAASDRESDVRTAAVSALGKFAAEDDRVPQVLITAVSDREPAVRAAAVSALALTASPEIVPNFKKALSDRDPGVRIEAVRGIAYLDRNSALQLINEIWRETDLSVQRAIVGLVFGEFFFVSKPNKVEQELDTMLRETVKKNNDWILPIIDLLRTGYSFIEIQKIHDLLKSVNDKVVVDYLISELNDDNIYYYYGLPNIVRILGTYDDDRVVNALGEALSYDQEDIRHAARESLIEIGTPEALKLVDSHPV